MDAAEDPTLVEESTPAPPAQDRPMATSEAKEEGEERGSGGCRRVGAARGATSAWGPAGIARGGPGAPLHHPRLGCHEGQAQLRDVELVARLRWQGRA